MYDLIRFVHVLTALIYFLFHGAIASVSFALRRAGTPERTEALEQVMRLVYHPIPTSLVIMVLSGLALGFLGSWWSDRWIWVSIGLLLFVGVLMNRLGKASLTEGFAAGREPRSDTNPTEARPGSNPPRAFFLHPTFLTVTGVVALAVITWLMMFKPG
ncbi:MAG TPA: DUF2269 family protein [Anaerolineales bacterium]|nr:DUF2269 family protein [Anaerolineales bacterium]